MAIIPKGGGGKPEEEKTVTAGTSVIEILPSSGKTMKKITVNPIPSQIKNVTPNESAQTVSPDSGKLLSSVSVGAIQTEEKTVTAGTSATTVTPTSGKYIKKITVNPTPSQSKIVSPSTSQQTVSPDAGKLLSYVIVNAMESGALSNITVSSAGLITAQVGTSGYLASGTKMTKQLTKQAAKTVTPSESVQTAVSSGRYTTGAVKVAAIPSKYMNLENIELTKYAIDTFTSSSRSLLNKTAIPHSLGEKPKVAILIAVNFTSTTSSDVDKVGLFNLNGANANGQLTYYYANGTNQRNAVAASSSYVTDSSITVGGSSYYYPAGQVYKLITMA